MTLPTPIFPDRTRFRALAREANLIPIHAHLIADTESPVSAFQKLDRGNGAFLLESAETHDAVGRYSFVGSDPSVTLQSRGRSIRISERGVTREFETQQDPLAEVQRLMGRYRPAHDPSLGPFPGGAVGYIGYDVVRFLEPTIPPAQPDPIGLPDLAFFITDTLLVFDHRTRGLRIIAHAFVEPGTDPDHAYEDARDRIHSILGRLRQPTSLLPMSPLAPAEPRAPSSNTSREDFERAVDRCKDHIRAGDIFQIVLSQRFSTPVSAAPLDVYRALRFVNPSPYMFCIKPDDRLAIVGSSPEVHVRMNGRTVQIRPIAGTRPRGQTPALDEANARELLADPKERAEHLMLVDLARNDIGRIAEFGSVKVTDFMTVERYSHVMHIVSNVVGTLTPGRSAFDVMRATFPAGTVTGAPKVRAMQLINGFEPHRRGPYAGAVGYFSFDGNSDSCITLRSVTLKDGVAHVQAGAGIVADSTPAGEFQETVNKAMGVLRALELTRQIPQ